MKATIISTVFISIFILIGFWLFYDTKYADEIISISGNLDNYRIIPEDTGGLEFPDLNIYELGE